MFWSWLYLWLTCLTMGYVLLSRRRDLLVAGLIIAGSWIMTNTILMTKAPDQAFLAYFAYDCTAFEILGLMLLRRFTVWNAVFMLATLCQLLLHLWYWAYSPPPFAYYERLNGFFWVQAIATILACVVPRRGISSAGWLKPRPVYRKALTLPPWRPRTAPGQRGRCPLIVRAWA